MAPASAQDTAPRAVELRLAQQPVATFRSTWVGITPDDRAQRAQRRLDELLSRPGPHRAAAVPAAEGRLLQVDGATAFVLTPADADLTHGETLDQAAAEATERLQAAIGVWHDSRDPRRWAAAAAAIAVATAVAAALLWAAARLRRVASRHAARLARRHADRLQVAGAPLLMRERVAAAGARAAWAPFWLAVLAVGYAWLSFSLARCPSPGGGARSWTTTCWACWCSWAALWCAPCLACWWRRSSCCSRGPPCACWAACSTACSAASCSWAGWTPTWCRPRAGW
ncbi:hypothetical protein [Ideonella sp.]|uniref:hypothetical protein n=1 Tax=Ideonella sp. TaxID=1929293 RepID=UPI0035B39DBC